MVSIPYPIYRDHIVKLTLADYPDSGVAQLARHQVLLMEQQLLKQLVEV
jgi:hypothetical protein